MSALETPPRRFRVYDSPFGSLRLLGVVAARSKDEAAQILADKKGYSGQERYLFLRLATVKMVKKPGVSAGQIAGTA